jgi:hypothetical protein
VLAASGIYVSELVASATARLAPAATPPMSGIMASHRVMNTSL